MATATIKVGGNGNYTAWTRSDTGVSAYTLVDEDSSHDSDTTYIYTSSNNNRSSFTLLASDLAALPAMITITSMTIKAYCRRSAGTAATILAFFRLGGADSDSTTSSTGSTYTQLSRTPSRPGGGSWTKDDLSTLEIGICMTTGTGTPHTVRCTAIYLEIAYDELSGGETFDCSLADTIQALTTAIEAAEKFVGTSALTMQPLSMTGAAAEEFVGSSALTLQPLSMSAQATSGLAGSLGLTLVAIQTAIAAVERFSGAVESSMQPITTEIEAAINVSGTIELTLQPIGSAIAASVSVIVTGPTAPVSLGPEDGLRQKQEFVDAYLMERQLKLIIADDNDLLEILSVAFAAEELWEPSLAA
jgi:hypothetical protein